MFLTAAGSAAALIALVLLLGFLDLPFLASGEGAQPSLAEQVAATLLFALAGAIIGFAQWLALKMIFPRSAWWILATGAGWLMGYVSNLIVAALAADLFNQILALIVPWLIIGLWSGLFQWLILRRFYPRVDPWVIIATISVVIGAIGWIVGSVCGGSLTWAIAGALTGYSLLKFEEAKAKNVQR